MMTALSIAIVATIYLTGVRHCWAHAGMGRGIRSWRVASFVAGILVLVVALASPLDGLADGLFSAHMAQHVLLAMVAPPLLVAGDPLVATLWLFPPSTRRAITQRAMNARRFVVAWQGVTAPSVAWVIHAIVLWAWHTPRLFEFALDHEWAHACEHLSFLMTASLMWWGILHSRRTRRAAYGLGVLALFATALQSGALGALITLSHRVWFPLQSSASLRYGMTPLEDQQLAGLIMWIPGGLFYLVAMGSLFLASMRRVPVYALLLVAGCSTPLSMFSPASESASRVTTLTWFMVILSIVVYVIVMAALATSLRRNRVRDTTAVDLSDPGITPIVIFGAVLPALVLAAIFVVAETALGKYPERDPALTIDVTGHQWWWQVAYGSNSTPAHFEAANEIHIPVGKPVRLVLTSADVIHSFWVPRLQGKIDVIPGDTNELRIVARSAGTYRGICQEFCGMQHANMGITVVADDSAHFAQWMADQTAGALQPSDSLVAEGQRVFASGPCATCHTVRGTSAAGTLAPDLTHVGSRETIAAGMLANNVGSLEAWIADAQSIKPGAAMPPMHQYDSPELRALAAYVSSLK